MRNLPTVKGFTMLEMLIALAILGILATLALPGFMETLGAGGVSGSTRSFSNALALARSEAITRNTTINVCPANTTMSDCAASSWSNGWIVFEDNNEDATGATGSIDSGDTTADVILQVFMPSSDTVVTGSSDLLGYSSRGFGDSATTQTFKFCPRNNDSSRARSIEVLVTGSTRLVSTGLACP
jgi:type IV fimbrial biogenesis protein FimT